MPASMLVESSCDKLHWARHKGSCDPWGLNQIQCPGTVGCKRGANGECQQFFLKMGGKASVHDCSLKYLIYQTK